jgi:uncharacterized protein (DUF1697 family)
MTLSRGPMTTRYVALLRGVNNIGTTRRVAMADLRVLFEDLGFIDVRTLLNSGNVVFSAAGRDQNKVLARVEKGLAARFGRSLPIILLSSREVARVVRDDPFTRVASNHSHYLVVTLVRRPDRRLLQPLLAKRWAPEALALGTRVAYLWCARGLARSPLRIAVERALGPRGTGRNMATMTKLRTLLEPADQPR